MAYALLQTRWPLLFLQPLLQGEFHGGFDPFHAGAAWQHLALGLLPDLTLNAQGNPMGLSCAQPQNAGK